MTKRIMFFMNVPWGTIKQRPHFIAEYLSDDYDLEIVTVTNFSFRKMAKNKTDKKMKFSLIFRLPFNRVSLIRSINKILIKLQVRYKLISKDYIWFTFPDQYNYIDKKSLVSLKSWYDCMDDYIEFPHIQKNLNLKKELELAEKNLIKTVSVVSFTSQTLKNKLMDRYFGDKSNQLIKEPIIINNALNIRENFELGNLHINNIENVFIEYNKYTKLTYIGAIAEWFDFDVVLKSLEEKNNIVYMLFGPKEVNIPSHPRIKYFGIVEHSRIYRIMELSDILIMPFKLTPLILSVNPVKAYEYIYSSKPVMLVKYMETEKFRDYVYLYETAEEYIKKITEIEKNNYEPKKTNKENIDYCNNNRWESRIDLIKLELERIEL